MAVSQIETIVVCVLTFLTLRLVKKLGKRWSSRKAYATLRNLFGTHDESDRPLPSTIGNEGEIQPNDATHSNRGPIVNVSEDDSEQIPQKGFDFEEFAEVFRKNFPAGRLPLRYAKSVTGEQRGKDYCGKKTFGRSNMDEDAPRTFGDGIQGSSRDPRGNQSTGEAAEGSGEVGYRNHPEAAEGSVEVGHRYINSEAAEGSGEDGYRNHPEGRNTGRPVTPPKELIPVGRVARYRYINKEGHSEKPTKYLFTSLDGRFKNIPVPCESCEHKGLTARGCLQQNISHRGLSPRTDRSTTWSKPTRTGWHPNWTNGNKRTRFQMENRNGPATMNRGKSVPRNKNRPALANRKWNSILKRAGVAGTIQRGSFAAFQNQSYLNTEDPKPSTSRVIKGTVSGRGRRQ